MRSSRDKRKISDAEKFANVDSNALNRLARSHAVVCVAFASGGNSARHGVLCKVITQISDVGDWINLHSIQLLLYHFNTSFYIRNF